MLAFRNLVVIPSILSSALVSAQSMDAHLHGVATLEIAVSGQEFHARFEAPAEDIWGFESAIQNDSQRSAVQAGLAKLQNAFMVLGGALNSQCELENTSFATRFEADELEQLLASAPASESETHAHAHDHGHDHATESTHSQVAVTYEFHCNDRVPAQLNLMAFNSFPSLQQIDVQWITDEAQGGAQLTPTNTRLNLHAH